MTPKEKAEELVEKMLHTDAMDMTRYCSKQCALIVVDEVLDYSTAHGFIGLTEFYLEVKQEIEKL
tara:strand:- start:477 stop:671 length:195 start_codon:yes stop_codon:yes gene_type:complete